MIRPDFDLSQVRRPAQRPAVDLTWSVGQASGCPATYFATARRSRLALVDPADERPVDLATLVAATTWYRRVSAAFMLETSAEAGADGERDLLDSSGQGSCDVGRPLLAGGQELRLHTGRRRFQFQPCAAASKP